MKNKPEPYPEDWKPQHKVIEELEAENAALQRQVERLQEALEPFAVLVAGSDEDHDWLPHPNEIMCGHGGRLLSGQAFINAIDTFGSANALEVLKALEVGNEE